MSRRWQPLLAWGLCLLTVALTATAIVLYVPLIRAGLVDESLVDALWPTWYLGFPLWGAVIVSRRRGHVIGWLLCLVGASLALAVSADTLARQALTTGAVPGTATLLLAWIATWAAVPGGVCVALLLLLYPTGRLPGPRWRPLPHVMVAAATGFTLVQGLRPGPMLGFPAAVNPFGVPRWAGVLEVLDTLFVAVLSAAALLALAGAVLRFRRSAGLERQQLKGAVVAACAFPVLMTVAGMTELHLLEIAAFVLAGHGFAAALGLAILRYRLYEIDRVVSRTVSYAMITAALAGVYAAGVVLLTPLLAGMGGASELAVAASTLAAAAAFGPLRRRVQAGVDRRFNRARYDAAQVVQSFSGLLRDEVDLAGVERSLAAAVQRTVAPTHCSVWLREVGS
jgi:hypothetical protein